MYQYKAEELADAVIKIAQKIAHPHQLARISETELAEARADLVAKFQELQPAPEYNPDE